MVYCGKPSTGCQACRDKKTRCDRLTPSCTQCIRAQRACPGYRNQLDLMFRNESDVVIERVKAREKQKTKSRGGPSRSLTPMTPSTPTTPASSILSDVPPTASEDIADEAHESDLAVSLRPSQVYLEGVSDPITTSYLLQPTMQERALGYFYSNPALWLQNSDILSVLSGQANADEHLLASMSAVGLASLSKSIRAPRLMVKAQKDYLTAIKLTNSALRSPSEVTKDSTLFAVMVLSMFETITGTDVDSIGSWGKHVKGAAALVKLRGMDQFYSESGQRIYAQVMGNLLLSCLQHSVPVPAEMLELRKEASRVLDTNTPSWKLMEVIINYITFRSDCRRLRMSCRQIVEGALDIDRQFIELYSNFPKDFVYRTFYTDKNPDLIWNGSYHEYENNWTPPIWNWIRVCRIMVHETISQNIRHDLAATSSAFTSDEAVAQLTSSNEILLEAQADVLASVPQYIGATSCVHGASPMDGSREWFILWPLYVAGAMDLATDDLREWVINRLESIADSAGISQAQILARHLALKQNMDAILETMPISGSTSKAAPVSHEAKYSGSRLMGA